MTLAARFAKPACGRNLGVPATACAGGRASASRKGRARAVIRTQKIAGSGSWRPAFSVAGGTGSDYWGERCHPGRMQTQAPPEAAGPGVERGDGAIIYGDETMPRVVIENLRDPEERARDLASYSGQC